MLIKRAPDFKGPMFLEAVNLIFFNAASGHKAVIVMTFSIQEQEPITHKSKSIIQ